NSSQQPARVSEPLQESGAASDAGDAFIDRGIYAYATPRRLAVHIKNVSTRQPDQDTVMRGPALKAAFDAGGRPTKAALGFARSCGVEVESLQKQQTDRGAWLTFHRRKVGSLTTDLLAPIVSKALANLPIPRRMRWGAGDAEFVRPVHWIVLLFGDDVVDAEILGIRTGRETRGHRFHCPEPLTIERPSAYIALLETKGRVVADFGGRRERIRQQVEALAHKLGGATRIDADLLDEVTALVEWPSALTGSFEPRFLALPPEVLITTMQDNQRYFPVMSRDDGRLLPHFIAVSNIESMQPQQVRIGNERVIRPRFSDAAFFWEQDRRRSLGSRKDQLKKVSFQERLGSLFDKTGRVETLVEFIAGQMGVDVRHARRAAELSKCDLLTDMVFEFPDLQGVMGRHYAACDGEPAAVSLALDEQYWPRRANDELPRSGVGQVLALAERVDTLLGIFAIGYRPSGEKDPFGLRRAALGVLRIMIERELDLDLEQTLHQACAVLADKVNAKSAVSETFEYIMERLKAYYAEREIQLDVINAVMARRPVRPLDFDRRVRAVTAFRNVDEAASLAAANKRIANLLRKAAPLASAAVDPSLLRDSAEQALFQRMQALSDETAPLFKTGDYQQALLKLAELQQPVDRFFDEVLVMAEDNALRHNRLALLAQLRSLFLRTADLSYLQ
ncbi:MAG: glycine--tRNA ligase subunit beta, partial [Gammaproteobacteria bacterium]|nr:glycine--tRNA ligase subunit beta [Gammaproteobacteria bacterium]